jgi:hypothetical protein
MLTAGHQMMARQAGASDDRTKEYRTKAAVILKLPLFVEWPAGTLDGHDHLDICVAQGTPFGPILDELVRGESSGGRALTTRTIAPGAPLDNCQLLVVSGTTDAAFSLLKQAASRPILTIGDRAGFLEDGGIVRLRVLDQHVRFDISAANAQRAGLRLSSQLLRLAGSVQGGPQ